MPEEDDQYGVRTPQPDPTKLTTDAMNAVISQYRVDIASLRELLEQRMNDLEKRLLERQDASQLLLDERAVATQRATQAAFESAEKAVNKAEIAAEKRFESINDFREELSTQVATLMTRNEANVRISAISEKIDSLELRVISRLDMSEGNRKGKVSAVQMMTATISIIIAMIIATVTIITST